MTNQRSIFTAAIAGCGMTYAVLTAPAAAQNIAIQAGSPTGSWYPAAVAISEVLQQENPDLRVTVGPGGGITNARAVHSGADADMGLIYSSTWQAAVNGADPFEQTLSDSCFVMALFEVVYHAGVPAESEIDSFGDLRDKRIMPGQTGWTTNLLTKEILEAEGVTYEEIREGDGQISFTAYDDMARAWADRQADFVAGFQGYPTAFWMNVSNSRDVRFLSVPKETADAVIDQIPGLVYTEIPAGAYPEINPDESIPTLGDLTIVIAHDGLDPNVVYNFAKTTFENREKLAKSSNFLSYISQDTLTKGSMEGEICPGAEKFYEELGAK